MQVLYFIDVYFRTFGDEMEVRSICNTFTRMHKLLLAIWSTEKKTIHKKLFNNVAILQ